MLTLCCLGIRYKVAVLVRFITFRDRTTLYMNIIWLIYFFDESWENKHMKLLFWRIFRKETHKTFRCRRHVNGFQLPLADIVAILYVCKSFLMLSLDNLFHPYIPLCNLGIRKHNSSYFFHIKRVFQSQKLDLFKYK